MTTPPLNTELLALQELLAGRYSIERELGRGGMGIVFLARDVALDRLVAIKLLPRALADRPEFRDRFLQEARTAAGLSHPNIVPIHSVEAHGELVFFVMGFVNGPTLRERVERRGPVSTRLAMKWMQEVAWALAYAHQRGVIHRDVKPDNIMIDQGTDRAIVTDFGIAVSRGAPEGTDGEVIGTARYMSPEQALGEMLDARSDLYALGATFFYAVTGRPPFDGKTLPAILAQQVGGTPPRVETLRPEIPAKFGAIIARCLAKAPEDRWPDGDELARGLGDARGREFRAPPLVRSFVRNAQVTTMVVLAALLAGQFGVMVSGQGVQVVGGGPGLITFILVSQLVVVARRLLREGYAFPDIHEALLAEARLQEEEIEELRQGKWLRRLNSLWHRMWAGRFGRWFFRVAGTGLKKTARRALPSNDATEFVLGRSTLDAYQALPEATRRDAREVPAVVEGLEARAERLRAAGETGERLNDTVAALENLRLALLKLSAGIGSADDLTVHLRRAKAIGEAVDRRLEAEREIGEAVGWGSRP